MTVAELCALTGQKDAARRSIKRAAEALADDELRGWLTWSQLGEVAARVGEQAVARDCVLRAEELAPKVGEGENEVEPRRRAEVDLHAAAVLVRLGDFAGADARFAAARKIAPELDFSTAEHFTDYLIALADAGKAEAAMKLVNNLIPKPEDRDFPRWWIAKALARSGRSDESWPLTGGFVRMTHLGLGIHHRLVRDARREGKLEALLPKIDQQPPRVRMVLYLQLAEIELGREGQTLATMFDEP